MNSSTNGGQTRPGEDARLTRLHMTCLLPLWVSDCQVSIASLRLDRSVPQETVLTATNLAQADVETPEAARGFPVRIRPLGLFSDDQFYEFCRVNSDLDPKEPARGRSINSLLQWEL